MLRLIQFPPAFGMRNPSPFCLKAEALLRHAQVPYQVDAQPTPSNAPKGKFPVLDDGGVLIPDSSLIRKHLEQRHGIDFDAGLTAQERAVALAFSKLCEDHLYFVLVHSRWVDETNWALLRAEFFSPVPWAIRGLIANKARANVRRKLEQHGMGGHDAATIYAFGADALQALAAQLEQGPYLMGASRCGADASVYAVLYSILACPLESPLKTAAQHHAVLQAYVDRMHAQYFADQRPFSAQS